MQPEPMRPGFSPLQWCRPIGRQRTDELPAPRLADDKGHRPAGASPVFWVGFRAVLIPLDEQIGGSFVSS
jgi:hypothetical protein